MEGAPQGRHCAPLAPARACEAAAGVTVAGALAGPGSEPRSDAGPVGGLARRPGAGTQPSSGRCSETGSVCVSIILREVPCFKVRFYLRTV